MGDDEHMEWLEDGVREKREEKSGVRLLEIPMFTLGEAHSVAKILGAHGIQHQRDVLHLGASVYRGYHAYTFWVREDQFMAAIAVLKEVFSIPPASADYTGVCPACGANVVSSPACPECDLNLSGDYGEAKGTHPFIQFLKHNKLLGGRDAEAPVPTDATAKGPARRVFNAAVVFVLLFLFALLVMEDPLARLVLGVLVLIAGGVAWMSVPWAFRRRARRPDSADNVVG
jgi:hypothetical protein